LIRKTAERRFFYALKRQGAYNRLLHFGASAMRYLVWALRLIVFVAVLMFALKNTDPVGVTFYGTWELQSVPLIVVMLSTFVLGTVFGLLLTVPASIRRRREVVRLKKDLERIQAAVNPPGTATLSPDAVVPLSPI
jgi:uncharacterized integral membrane protein